MGFVTCQYMDIEIRFVFCKTVGSIFCCLTIIYRMCGVLSEAMVMCVSTPEKVEILDLPTGSVPGDRVIVEVYIYRYIHM